MLIEYAENGHYPALKEILNRMLGATIRNIQIDVSQKKLIQADTRLQIDSRPQDDSVIHDAEITSTNNPIIEEIAKSALPDNIHIKSVNKEDTA